MFAMIEIPLVCFGILLWILCWQFIKKRKEEQSSASRATNSPPVYVIPIYEEEREDEEVMDIYEARFRPPYRDPPMYSLRNVSPPPPYRLEPSSCPDPPPSYTDPPAYSEQP